ncbi:MAG: hypothetical protein RLZZ500_1297 [Bacteroidota bacterium]
MLSILIPTYDRDMLPLVEVLRQQCIATAYPFEIVVFDDASLSAWNRSNAQINTFEHCRFVSHSENKGRAANRNALAATAQGSHFLFLDGDMMPLRPDFIANYINALPQHQVLFGGITYETEKPEPLFRLRWTYGKKREEISVQQRQSHPYATCLTSNLCIERKIFEAIKFNDLIASYGYEDLVFVKGISKMNQPVTHLDNPAIHLGLEETAIFLAKTNQALENAKKMVQKGWITSQDIKALKWHKRILGWRLKPIIYPILHLFSPYMNRNLHSENPSVLVFDCYKLYYLLRN